MPKVPAPQNQGWANFGAQQSVNSSIPDDSDTQNIFDFGAKSETKNTIQNEQNWFDFVDGFGNTDQSQSKNMSNIVSRVLIQV